MANYYEMLNISPSASISEIEAVLDEQYNKWRRLVTHHDPQIVEKANRSLRVLEQIRETLTNTANRKIYDQSLNVGGLADPDAVLKSMGTGGSTSMTPPPPQSQSPKVAASTTVEHWVCAKCDTANKVGTVYCTKCGNAVGQRCPQCNEIIAIDAKFCSGCGIDVIQKKRELIEQATEAWKNDQKHRIEQYRTQIKDHQSTIRKLEAIKDRPFPFWGNYDANLLHNVDNSEGEWIIWVLMIAFSTCSCLSCSVTMGEETSGVLPIITLIVSFLVALHMSGNVNLGLVKSVNIAIEEQKDSIRNLEKQIAEVQQERFEDSHFAKHIENQATRHGFTGYRGFGSNLRI